MKGSCVAAFLNFFSPSGIHIIFITVDKKKKEKRKGPHLTSIERIALQ